VSERERERECREREREREAAALIPLLLLPRAHFSAYCTSCCGGEEVQDGQGLGCGGGGKRGVEKDEGGGIDTEPGRARVRE
jgi:hypothetical protein